MPQELFEKSGLPNLDLYFLKNNVAKHLDKIKESKIEYIVKVT